MKKFLLAMLLLFGIGAGTKSFAQACNNSNLFINMLSSCAMSVTLYYETPCPGGTGTTTSFSVLPGGLSQSTATVMGILGVTSWKVTGWDITVSGCGATTVSQSWGAADTDPFVCSPSCTTPAGRVVYSGASGNITLRPN